MFTRRIVLYIVFLFVLAACCPARNTPQPTDGDFIIKDFKFESGETLPELKIHYVTLGEQRKDASGRVTNAVLILHGTGGTHAQFLSRQFGDVLFGKGQLLDAEKYFIVIPDNVGHGASSKPSNGLHAR